MNIIKKHTTVNYSKGNSGRKYIVIHYTGNKTDTAAANANYFYSVNRGASAHYFVDEKDIYEVVDPSNTSWAVGVNYGKNNLFGVCTNRNSISIEMCSTGGKIANNTFALTVELVKYLMGKYGILASHVVRHYDVCTKSCPGWAGWLPPNETLWNNFKAAVGAASSAKATVTEVQTNAGSESSNAQTVPTAKPSATTRGSSNVSTVQSFCNSFVGAGIAVDGIRGVATNKAVIKVLQECLNKDYGAGLAVDGIAGTKTLKAIGKHYVKRGETQYMVTFVEVALKALGYYGSTIETPGIFGAGLKTAVSSFQGKNSLTVDSIAGAATFKKLISKFK